MAVNADKIDRWKADIARSVDFYNDWFIKFAPKTYRETRLATIHQVESALAWTANLTDISGAVLREHPEVLAMLRMSTAPPLARDRLIGLAAISPSLVRSMEIDQRIPSRMVESHLDEHLTKIGRIINQLADIDIFPWLEPKRAPKAVEIHRAATIVADRLCGSMADPLIRNAQEKRQLAALQVWLESRGYTLAKASDKLAFNQMHPGTIAFRLNVPVKLEGGVTQINIPIDTVAMPRKARKGALPILIEAKSAGDFTNTNKRRKEEAAKISQLRKNYGPNVRFVLFLCGYFDSGYLGYEAAEGIDWVWEHRIEDLAKFGL